MNNPTRTIDLLLVDDHPLVRHGVAAILRTQPDFNVVAEASTARQAISLLQKTPVSVILLDIRLPDEDGFAVLAFVANMPVKPAVLILSSHDGENVIGRALSNGALGFVSKGTRAPEFIRAVRSVAAGHRYVSPDLSHQLASFLTRAQPTAREIQILELVASGASNAEIGKRLGVTEKTIKNQLTTLFGKLGASDRTQAVVIAVERGLIELAVVPA